MPTYAYTARDSVGKMYRGSLEAVDEKMLRAQLREMGYYTTSITKRLSLLSWGSSKKGGRIRPGELVAFSQQFAAMIKAGLSLTKCLSALEEQSENPQLREVLRSIQLDIAGGATLSVALSKHPQIFSGFFVTMVRAGEMGGVLPAVLERLARHLEKGEELRRKVKSAFAYPIIVLCAATVVIAFLVIFIIPVFADVYGKLRVDLPGPTKSLIALSNFARQFWWVILILIIAFKVGYTKFRQSDRGREILDRFKLRMPVFGNLNRKAVISRFIRTLGDMLTSGIPLVQCLEVAEAVAGNTVISKVVDKVKANIRKGRRISEPLKSGGVFPQMVVQMVAAGEESGTLETILPQTADSLEQDVDNTVKSLIVKIEPLLTVGLAAVIGFIALAIYLPMFDMIKAIKK